MGARLGIGAEAVGLGERLGFDGADGVAEKLGVGGEDVGLGEKLGFGNEKLGAGVEKTGVGAWVVSSGEGCGAADGPALGGRRRTALVGEGCGWMRRPG